MIICNVVDTSISNVRPQLFQPFQDQFLFWLTTTFFYGLAPQPVFGEIYIGTRYDRSVIILSYRSSHIISNVKQDRILQIYIVS